jgi:hypothetical protein
VHAAFTVIIHDPINQVLVVLFGLSFAWFFQATTGIRSCSQTFRFLSMSSVCDLILSHETMLSDVHLFHLSFSFPASHLRLLFLESAWLGISRGSSGTFNLKANNGTWYYVRTVSHSFTWADSCHSGAFSKVQWAFMVRSWHSASVRFSLVLICSIRWHVDALIDSAVATESGTRECLSKLSLWMLLMNSWFMIKLDQVLHVWVMFFCSKPCPGSLFPT